MIPKDISIHLVLHMFRYQRICEAHVTLVIHPEVLFVPLVCFFSFLWDAGNERQKGPFIRKIDCEKGSFYGRKLLSETDDKAWKMVIFRWIGGSEWMCLCAWVLMCSSRDFVEILSWVIVSGKCLRNMYICMYMRIFKYCKCKSFAIKSDNILDMFVKKIIFLLHSCLQFILH